MPVPNTFATATTSIPLSQLDQNFATTITLGNTAIQLGNTVTTLNNMTLANVTISSVASTFPNNYLANSAVTIGNTSVSLGSTQTSFGNVTLTNATISSVATTFPNNFLANSTATLGNATITLGSTTSTVGNLTLNNVTINSGTVTGTVSNATSDSASVVGYMGLPQNSQNGNYNVVLADSGKHIYHPAGQAAATYTFPANSNVAFTTGSAVTIVNGSANNVTISLTTDTLYLASNGATGSRTLTQYGVATALKVTSTVWIISGTNLT